MDRFIDLTGNKFGKWTVIKRVENDRYGQTRYLCRCECGNEKVVMGKSLRRGLSKSCRCPKNLTGMKFGFLSVGNETYLLDKKGCKLRAYYCLCDCGKEKIVLAKHLTSGHCVSCGCYGRSKNRMIESVIKIKYCNIEFGCRNPLYEVWHGIKKRCSDEKEANYYGRGITICDEWRNDFQAFYDWAMANGYKVEKLSSGKNRWTIDRIDNDGNYEPNNCRWVDIKAQSNNKRTNHYLEYKGKTQSIADWGRELGVSASLITQRINKGGWSIEEALTIPSGERRKSSVTI